MANRVLRGLAAVAVFGSAFVACEQTPTSTVVPDPKFMAAGAHVDGFSFKGELVAAIASFSSVDEAGIQTDVSVFVDDEKSRQSPEPPFPRSNIQLGVSRFRADCPPSIPGCPPRIMNAGVVTQLADDDFRAPAVSPGSRARLHTTVDVFDFVSNSSFEIVVDMTWVCIGDVTHFNEAHHFVLPGATVDLASHHVAHCDAQASGSVSDGVTNFTPEPSLPPNLIIFSETTVEVVVTIVR